MRGGDDAYVDRHGLRAADALEAALLEHPKDLGLRLGGHVSDLVEEDRAAVRRLEAADPTRVRAGEGAPLVPEELALHQLPADRGAVHRDERALPARAALVQRLRDELLPGAALAAHEHREIGLRDLLDQLEDPPHGRARADQVLEAQVAIDALEQQPVLALEPRALQRTAHDQADLVVVERLGDVVLGAGLHRLHGDLLVAVRRDHDDGGLGPRLLHGAQDVHARNAAAEREVGEHQVDRRFAQACERRFARVGDRDLVALPPQQPGQRELDRALVLDDEDARGHAGLVGAAASLRAFGNASTNSVPAPGADCASIVPSCASTSFFVMARPRPVPSGFEV